MFKDKEKLYQAYHTLLSMALTWALTLAINQYFGLRAHVIQCAFYSFLPAILIYLFNLNKKNAISYILLGSVFPILALIFWLRKVNPIDWINDLIGWCAQYNGSEELYVANHANFIIFAVGCAGAILFFLLTNKQLAKIILAVVLMATMIILSVSEVDINKGVVGICIFYILTIIVELCGIFYSKKAGKSEKKEGILYLAPVCLLLAVLSISLPSKPEPLQWAGIKHIYNDIKEQFDVWKTEIDYLFHKAESEFNVNLTGFSDESNDLSTANGLTKDHKIALKVSGAIGSSPVYLIGSISDVYTGRRWEKSREDYIPGEKEYLLDYSELIYALTRLDLEVLENNRFIERDVFKVEYNNIKTKTFFYPIKTSQYEMLYKSDGLSTEPGNITFPEMRGKGTVYENIYFEMNLQGDAFQQMLREADSFSYENFEGVKLESLQWVQKNVIYQDLTDTLLEKWNFYELFEKRAEMIKAHYTVLPEGLPDRVRDLALEITKNFDTKYDKLKAIESFLREYTYSLDPEQVPKGEDFTDYFLFESQEGYCTSYATAMAILGRCLGIPTRYVEGFVVQFTNRDDNFMFPVRNSQAHAWAEAYFEGVGWIPFEATSPFYSYRYTKWREIPRPEDTIYSNFDNPYDQEDLQNQMGLNTGDTGSTVVEEESNSGNVINGFVIFISAMVILLLFLIIYYFVLKYRYNQAFQKADNSKKMYMLFLRILSFLKQEGFVLGQQETILMLSGRVNDRFHYNRIIFSDIANIFMRYRYAEEEVSLEEFKQVAVFCEGLSNKQREEQRRLKRWLEEFVFLAKKSNR